MNALLRMGGTPCLQSQTSPAQRPSSPGLQQPQHRRVNPELEPMYSASKLSVPSSGLHPNQHPCQVLGESGLRTLVTRNMRGGYQVRQDCVFGEKSDSVISKRVRY